MTTGFPSKLKDPRTCRVFFSSPFGGMEEEREELTRKYFPQIHHLCNSRGIQFVPVDMRWGITSEAAENAQTVNICLRELDRCDIFVGFYGQRYGWCGAEDKLFQQNIDNAIGRYPWLNDFRDRSATELEFLHGHLNNPGALPACFCFRDKTYDANKAESFDKHGDRKMAEKFRCESEEAKTKLQLLKEKVQDSEDKTLSVNMEYPTPEEGAKHIFDSVWKHLNSVLLTGSDDEKVSEKEKELAEHHAFMASRQALYVGGDKYFSQLDGILTTDVTEKVLVRGQAGQGKSALLANWVSSVRQSQPSAVLAYHFVGASKDSGTSQNILRRLVWEVSGKSDEERKSDNKIMENKATEESTNKDLNGNSDKNSESGLSNPDRGHLSPNNEENGSDKVDGSTFNKDKDTDLGNSNQDKNGFSKKDKEENDNVSSEDKSDNDSKDMKKADITKSDNSGVGDENKGKDGREPTVKTVTDDSKPTDASTYKEKGSKSDSETPDSKNGDEENKEKKEKKKTEQELMTELQTELEAKKDLVVIVIDGLDKIETGKVTKPVFWLPDTFPKNVKIVVSTLDTDLAVMEELVTARKYQNIKLEDLELDHRTQICEKTLEKSGKALSKDQLQKVVDKEQTKNPLFLKIILAELSVFGYYRKLDEKITALLTPNSVGELFMKFLERLESDYNTVDLPDVVQQVFKVLHISREGLSETELTEMLNIPTHVWSSLYFALEQFIVVHSGLIRLAFSELSDAVVERYLFETGNREATMKCMINYFNGKRKTFTLWPKTPWAVMRHTLFELPWLQKDVNDMDGLVETLTDLVVFYTYIQNDDYDLLELWKSTGQTFDDIAGMYIKAFDQALVDIHCLEKEGLYTVEDEKRPPGQRIVSHLENVRYFVDLAGCTSGSMKVIERIISLLENLENVYREETDRQKLLAENRYYLACCYSDDGQFPLAEELHRKVMTYWKEGKANGTIEEKLGDTRVAWVMNGLGLNRLRQRKYAEAEEYFEECLQLHRKHNNKRHIADSMMNRGLARLRQANLIQAKDDMEETLKMYEEIFFGKLPHEIGNLYTNLGLIYRRLKKLNEAEKYYFKSLDIKAKAVGWDHLIIATCYMNLGTLEMHRRRWDKAEEYTIKALNIYKLNQVGDDIIEYRHCRENMANCLLRQDKFEEAKPFYWSVFEVLTRLGEMAECLPWVHNTMGCLYVDARDYEKAEKILTALANCPERRKPDTYLHLEELYKLCPHLDRPRERTLEFGIELWPQNAKLLECKIQRDLLPHADIDGIMELYSTQTCRQHMDMVKFIRGKNKPGIAWEVVEKMLGRFPEDFSLKIYAVELLYFLKQFDKALPIVDALVAKGMMSTSTRVTCTRILIGADKKEEAKACLKPLSSIVANTETGTEVREMFDELGLKIEDQEEDGEKQDKNISYNQSITQGAENNQEKATAVNGGSEERQL